MIFATSTPRSSTASGALPAGRIPHRSNISRTLGKSDHCASFILSLVNERELTLRDQRHFQGVRERDAARLREIGRVHHVTNHRDNRRWFRRRNSHATRPSRAGQRHNRTKVSSSDCAHGDLDLGGEGAVHGAFVRDGEQRGALFFGQRAGH